MTHPDDDALLDLALATVGPRADHGADAPDRDVLDHVRDCPTCADTVQEYTRTIELASSADAPAFDPPPASTWEAIAAQIADDPDTAHRRENTATPAATTRASSQTASIGRGTPTAQVAAVADRPRRRRWPWFAGGVAAGLATGLLAATLLTGQDEPAAPTTPQVLASAALAPPEGGATDGQAELVREGDTDLLDVRVPGMSPAPSDEVYEVWLLHRDGTRMVSIGVMPGGEQARFPIPTGLLDEGYDTVDISGEPLDEDATHSGNSLLRGRLGA